MKTNTSWVTGLQIILLSGGLIAAGRGLRDHELRLRAAEARVARCVLR